MSTPETSPKRYGVRVETETPRIGGTPENFDRRFGNVNGVYGNGSTSINITPPQPKEPETIQLIPDSTRYSSAEAWTKRAEAGVKMKPIGDAVEIAPTQTTPIDI